VPGSDFSVWMLPPPTVPLSALPANIARLRPGLTLKQAQPTIDELSHRFGLLAAAAGEPLKGAGFLLKPIQYQQFHFAGFHFALIGAVLAVWNYPRPRFEDAELDRRFFSFYSRVVGPYWPPERRHIESGYRTLPFPFEEIETPEFGLELRWNLDQVVGYVSSWSATARYRQALGTDPVPLLRESIAPAWPGVKTSVPLRMPIGLRVGRLRS